MLGRCVVGIGLDIAVTKKLQLRGKARVDLKTMRQIVGYP